jgi:hypothetical protein
MVPPIRQTEQRRGGGPCGARDHEAMRLRQFAAQHGGAVVEGWKLFGAASFFSEAAE